MSLFLEGGGGSQGSHGSSERSESTRTVTQDGENDSGHENKVSSLTFLSHQRHGMCLGPALNISILKKCSRGQLWALNSEFPGQRALGPVYLGVGNA